MSSENQPSPNGAEYEPELRVAFPPPADPEEKPEREYYVILSDQNAINALALSWVVLLIALIVSRVQLRRVQAARG